MPQPRPVRNALAALTVPLQAVDVDLLFIPVFQQDDRMDELAGIDAVVGGEWSRALESREFSHRPYDTFVARVTDPGWKAARVCFVGAGPLAEIDMERLRRIGATCGYAARQRAARSAAVLVRNGLDLSKAASAFADGLSAVEFDAGCYKSDKDR